MMSVHSILQRTFLSGLTLAVLLSPGSALGHDQVLDLRHDDPEGQDRFASALDIQGDILVAGAPGQHSTGGAVYVHERLYGKWPMMQKLTAPGNETGAWFGFSTRMSGDLLVVGSLYGDGAVPDSGAAHAYRRVGGSWQFEATLTAPAMAYDAYGFSVAADGDTVIVGSPYYDGVAASSGIAYVFENSGGSWSSGSPLLPPDGGVDQFFGLAVALHGDVAVVSAPFDDDQGFASGSAYVYTRSGSTWSFQQKLTASDGATNGRFGEGIGLHDDRMLISRPFANAVYAFAFDGNSWSEVQKLEPTSGGLTPTFGRSLDLDADTAVIGNLAEHHSGINAAGAGYIYRHDGTAWTLHDKIKPDTMYQNMHFAETVAVDRGDVVVGVPKADNGGLYGGELYLFSSFVPYGSGCPGTGGIVPSLSMSGRPESGGDVTVRIDSALGGAVALVLVGSQTADLPLGQGCSLLLAPILSTASLTLPGSNEGEGFAAIPAVVPASAVGMTATIQAVILDDGSTRGFAVTNGVEVEFL